MSNKRLKVSHGGSGISLCSSSPSAEVPSASISDLPNDLLKHCFSFIPGSYITVAPICRQFFSNYSTLGIHESVVFNSADSLLKIGKNKRTTVDVVSNDIKLTEFCFINNAPKDFMIKVCRKAASKGRIDILECAFSFGIAYSEMVGYKNVLMNEFANKGNLEMIQYFDSKLGEHFDEDDWFNMFQEAMYSYSSKCLHIMKWIFQEKLDPVKDHIAKTFIEAYEDAFEDVTAPRVTQELCEIAALCGNIELLEYCRRNNYQFDVDDADNDLCHCAVENNDKEQALATVKWLRQHGCGWDEWFCGAAVSSDNIEALKLARNDGCPWDQRALAAAIKEGNVPIIEYCLQNECPITMEICSSAMSIKDHNIALEVLKLLRKYSCPWDESTCGRAISGGHFEAMLWAKRNGCHWSEDDFFLLVQKGDISTLQIVLRDEPQHNTDKTFTALLSNHSSNAPCVIEKFKLLREYGYQWNTNTSAEAANYNKLRVLQWLRHAGCPMDADTSTAASRKGNIEILKYAHEVAGCRLSREAYLCCFAECCLGDIRTYIPTTVRDSHREVLKYLEKNDCPRLEKSK